MDKILLLLMLNGDVNQADIDKKVDLYEDSIKQDEDKRKAEQYKSVPMPAPAEPKARICIKTGKNKECKELTQAEISSGVVRGNKIVDEEQP